MKRVTDAMIKVMQAYSDGKEIEFMKRGVKNSKWTSIYDVTWDWVTYDYRIKPEPHYVPYDSVDEIDKNKWIRRKDTRVDRQIVMIDDDRNQIAILEINNWLYWLKLAELFRDWEYEDGTPFGKLADK